jgi:hypothetical protein
MGKSGLSVQECYQQLGQDDLDAHLSSVVSVATRHFSGIFGDHGQVSTKGLITTKRFAPGTSCSTNWRCSIAVTTA